MICGLKICIVHIHVNLGEVRLPPPVVMQQQYNSSTSVVVLIANQRHPSTHTTAHTHSPTHPLPTHTHSPPHPPTRHPPTHPLSHPPIRACNLIFYRSTEASGGHGQAGGRLSPLLLMQQAPLPPPISPLTPPTPRTLLLLPRLPARAVLVPPPPCRRPPGQSADGKGFKKKNACD